MSSLLAATAVLLLCLLAIGSGTKPSRPPAPVDPEFEVEPLPIERLDVQGVVRTVRYYVPSRIAERPALVIALHGGGGDGERFRRLTNRAFEAVADEHGLVIAYPDGLGGHWNGCRSRAPHRAVLAAVDDGAFLGAVARRAATLVGRELAGAFVAGYSNGGHLVFRLALESPTHFDAYAVIGASLPVPEECACRSSNEAVSILLVNGTEDPINPWEGGRVVAPGGTELGRVVSARATASRFVELADPAAAPTIVEYYDRRPDDGTRVEAHRWIFSGAEEVVWMIVHGAGHTLPHPKASFPPSLTGPTSRDIDGAAEIWSFFARQMRAERNGDP